jgi:uncharacterized cupredoxin-like copper-binding protein
MIRRHRIFCVRLIELRRKRLHATIQGHSTGKWEEGPMSGVSRVALLLVIYMLAGCSALRTDVRSEAPPGYQADAASKTASVDWSKVQTVTVGMDEYDYVPSSLNLEAGKPYRLHLENSGGKSHTYSSESFFKSIAAWRLMIKDGVVEAPFIQELVVVPGQAADLEFVALTPGNYPLVCNEPLHEVFGMSGTIHVR